MQAINEGFYDWDIANGSIYYSERVRNALGISPEEVRTPAAFLDRLHPDDRARFGAATLAHFKAETERFECDYRFRARDGSWRWARQHGVALRDARGHAVRMIGSTGDITELKERERQVAEHAAETKEALARQTATAEILRVISSSPTSTAPVFDAILESGTRLCEADLGLLFRFEAGMFRAIATRGAKPRFEAFLRQPNRFSERTGLGRLARTKAPVHIPDLVEDAAYREGDPLRLRTVELGGVRTWLGVPMLRKGELIGAIVIYRREVRPFDHRQVKLLETFADQAVIAIENVRLFNELEARNRELAEALEQQTATAEILRVISKSPTDLQPVLDAVVESAARLCGSDDAVMRIAEGDGLRLVAHFGSLPDRGADDVHPIVSTTIGSRAFLERRAIHVEDIVEEFRKGNYPDNRALQEPAGYRTVLAMPLLREDTAIGLIVIRRMDVQPFTDKQIALLKTFADQAVIAIENVRLFNETREALEQQKASAEVLRVISSSVADTQPVFEKILESCERLFASRNVGIELVGKDGAVHLAAHHGPSEFERHFPIPLTEESGGGGAILQRRVLHYPDVEAPGVPEYARRGSRIAGLRSVMFAPMLWEGRGIGAIYVGRETAGEFSEKEIALAKTFADQAVIAIQNARLFQELQAKNRELTEALEQQTATAEILRVISSSPTDLAPVFDAVARSAARLCDAPDVVIVRAEGGAMRFAASVGPFGQTFGPDLTVPIARGSVAGRALLERRTIQVDDLAAELEGEYAEGKALQRRYGHRTMVAAPLLLGDTALGAIAMLRKEVRPFGDKQLTLLRTFADQAVIAIENARLFNETKEALDYQRASAEVLQVISSSVADTRPVFEKILESCERLFEGQNVGVCLVGDDGAIHLSAYHGPNRDELMQHFPVPLEMSANGTAILRRRVLHYPDVEAESVPDYARRGCRIGGNRSALFAPMLWEGRGIGSIFVGRATVGEFSEKEIALLKTFADQAVIAIQNARLFNETKEALDHQRASAEVLQVISSSVADTQPVFDKILERCERLFVGQHVGINLVGEDGAVHLGPYRGARRSELERIYPLPLSRESASGSAILERRVMHYPDTEGGADVPEPVRRASRFMGFKSAIFAPMLWEGRAIGTIWVNREFAGPFSDKEIALLRTFADQAVIAIQNARLFNETKDALDQQKASAEVLQVISSSVADTKPVFDKILESCGRLFEGQSAGISLVGEDGAVHLAAYQGTHRDELERHYPVPLSEDSGAGAAILHRRVVHYPDARDGADVPEYMRRGARIAGYRSAILAPMLWEGRGIGVIFVWRAAVGEFSEKEIALLKTFADQAVIAIQNAKLFHEIQEKSHQLEIANQHKSAFLANMSHELRTPLNAVIGFSEMLAARYFGDLTDKQAEYVNDIHGSGKHLLSLINDILDLSKIEAGRMELEAAEFDLRAALDNALTLVRERAQRSGIALRFEADPALGTLRGDERKVKQVVLNLLSNAVKFTPRGGAVGVVARQANGSAEIAVSDTGVGIAPADQEAIFEAFRQVGTDVTRKREGTGLGLALTRRFVELHGGTIRVESAPGKGSTFTVMLPIRHGE